MIDTGLLTQVFFRLLILAIVALLVVRLMGNRTVGQLSPFDFVIMVGIGDIIVASTMEQSPTLQAGIESLLILLVLQQLLGYLALKNNTLRKWFEGTPVTLIQDGRILKENFTKTRFNYDDLRQELHKNGLDISDLSKIESARLESCGEFTMIRTADNEPLTKQEFENYLKNLYDNPLSPTGEKWAKLEKLMEDIQYLTIYLKKQQELPLISQDINFSKEKNLH